jgi:hypothetical protein
MTRLASSPFLSGGLLPFRDGVHLWRYASVRRARAMVAYPEYLPGSRMRRATK